MTKLTKYGETLVKWPKDLYDHGWSGNYDWWIQMKPDKDTYIWYNGDEIHGYEYKMSIDFNLKEKIWWKTKDKKLTRLIFRE